ncbi:hypothetical protein V8C86DRAFT_2446146 [Haematococcus lacustris]
MHIFAVVGLQRCAASLVCVLSTASWVGGQISTVPTLTALALPSAVCLLLPMAGMSAWAAEVQGSLDPQEQGPAGPQAHSTGLVWLQVASRLSGDLNLRGRLVLSLGLGSLLLVPCFKALTGLPPYLGMLAGLGFIWLFVDALHYGEPPRWEGGAKRPGGAERAKGAGGAEGIEAKGQRLRGSGHGAGAIRGQWGCLNWVKGQGPELAQVLDQSLGSTEALAVAIGLASALVDNVPLVAAAMGMYSLDQYPTDDRLWQLVAYAAGTGGSLLIIGSASGVAFMGLEQARCGSTGSVATRGKALEGRTMLGNTFQGATMEGGAMQGKTMLGKTFQHASMEGGAMQGKTMLGKTFQHASMEGGAMQGKTMLGKTFQHASMEGGAMQGKTMLGKTFQHASMEGGAMQGKTMLGKTFQHASMEGGAMQGGEIAGAAATSPPSLLDGGMWQQSMALVLAGVLGCPAAGTPLGSSGQGTSPCTSAHAQRHDQQGQPSLRPQCQGRHQPGFLDPPSPGPASPPLS